MSDLSRRHFIAGLGMTASLPFLNAAAAAQAPARLLPLNTPKIDHLDVIVPNVEASARFYMGVFNTTLHAQPFQGGFRYFVLFGDLPANRQVGYLAIGDSRGRGTYIGHFCTSVFDTAATAPRIAAALAEAVAKEGLGKLTVGGGFGGIFSDPDGIEIQFLPAPDTLVTAAVPSPLAESHKGLVTPKGVDRSEAAHRALRGQGGGLRPPHGQRGPGQAGCEDRAVAGRSQRPEIHGPRRHLRGAERMTRVRARITDNRQLTTDTRGFNRSMQHDK